MSMAYIGCKLFYFVHLHISFKKSVFTFNNSRINIIENQLIVYVYRTTQIHNPLIFYQLSNKSFKHILCILYWNIKYRSKAWLDLTIVGNNQ